LVLLDGFSIKDGKTREMAKLIGNLSKVLGGGVVKKTIPRQSSGQEKQENKKTNDTDDIKKTKKIKPKKVLLLLEKKDEKAQRACKNIKWLSCGRAQDVNVLDILGNEFVLTSVGGAKKIEQTFDK